MRPNQATGESEEGRLWDKRSLLRQDTLWEYATTDTAKRLFADIGVGCRHHDARC